MPFSGPGAVAPDGTTGAGPSSNAPPGVASSTTSPVGSASADVVAPARKTRSWRKERHPATAPIEPPGAVAPMQPPSEPPANPVPLKLKTPLPPPPPEAPGAPGSGPVVWKPPIDPATGAALWDQTAAPVESPPKKARGWRKGAKAGAVAAAGGAGAAAVADRADADTAVAGAPTPAAKVDAGPPAGSPWPTAPGGGFEPVVTAPKPASRGNRTTLFVLLAVLLVVIGGVAYFAVNRNSNSTPTTVAAPTPSPAVADAALATSINLRLTDLPAGWSRASGASLTPRVAPTAVQARAAQALAACLGQPLGVVAGLFGNSALPGQSVAVRSPTFQSGTTPTVQMVSDTAVLQTAADTQALAAPFANPNFAVCFGQYQSSLAAGAVAGSTAQVQTVQLQGPAGVKSYGYITTVITPGQGTLMVGEAFLLGGRTETLLEPSTNGPSIPAAPFTSAYDSITARMAQSVDK
jgi:hypothetical protein